MTRKKIFKATLFILIAGLLLFALPGEAGAFTVPALPHSFYGDVRINGIDAPAGTKVEVKGTGVKTGANNPIYTTETGKYGTSGPTGTKLIAQGDVDGDNIPDIIIGAPKGDGQSSVGDWWDTDCSYRKKLIFDNSGQSEALVNFPVLVKLSSSNFLVCLLTTSMNFSFVNILFPPY